MSPCIRMRFIIAYSPSDLVPFSPPSLKDQTSMTVIPNFILKRMYKSGSLRRLPDGIGFDIINNLGPGQISQVNSVTLNGKAYGPEHLVLIVSEELIQAQNITEATPATFFLNQTIVCLIRDTELPAGKYEITLNIISREAGKVELTVSDHLADAVS